MVPATKKIDRNFSDRRGSIVQRRALSWCANGSKQWARSGRNEYSARGPTPRPVSRSPRCQARQVPYLGGGSRPAERQTSQHALTRAGGALRDATVRDAVRRRCNHRDGAVAAPPAKSGHAGHAGHAARKNFHGHWGHCLSERSTWRPRRPLGPLRCPFVDSPATLGHAAAPPPNNRLNAVESLHSYGVIPASCAACSRRRGVAGGHQCAPRAAAEGGDGDVFICTSLTATSRTGVASPRASLVGPQPVGSTQLCMHAGGKAGKALAISAPLGQEARRVRRRSIE